MRQSLDSHETGGREHSEVRDRPERQDHRQGGAQLRLGRGHLLLQPAGRDSQPSRGQAPGLAAAASSAVMVLSSLVVSLSTLYVTN